MNFRRKLFWYIEHKMRTDSEKNSRAERERARVSLSFQRFRGKDRRRTVVLRKIRDDGP